MSTNLLNQELCDNGSTCVIIDEHAMIQIQEKPQNCHTVGDCAAVFAQAVLKHCKGTVERDI